MKTDILRECPFCGSNGMVVRVSNRGYAPMCTDFDCIAYGIELKQFATKKEAIEAWNRRVKDDKH
jgi:Lar family restriction alleviation protein